jgi:LmbE family N-acetylglucosaminyl deacetylase
MRLDFQQERVLAVVAHPDDAELLCAGTLARARSDGASVAISVLCRGEKGQPDPPIEDLAAVRREESEAAAALLGAELYCGNVPDGTLARSDGALPALIDVFRRFRPTLVLAHVAEDYHSDHRAAAALAEAASWQCASRGLLTNEPATAAHPALWWMDTVGMHAFTPGFYVDVSEFAELKERMLACHQSQLRRGKDEDFAPLLDLLRLQSAARGRQAGVRAAEAFRIHDAFQRARAW